MGDFLRDILKVSFVFTGTLIGAGFASGGEINQYFITDGKVYVISFLVCFILFSMFGNL